MKKCKGEFFRLNRQQEILWGEWICSDDGTDLREIDGGDTFYVR